VARLGRFRTIESDGRVVAPRPLLIKSLGYVKRLTHLVKTGELFMQRRFHVLREHACWGVP
jgi:hypothetical protein